MTTIETTYRVITTILPAPNGDLCVGNVPARTFYAGHDRLAAETAMDEAILSGWVVQLVVEIE